MAEYVTKIRTSDGVKQIDYNALANLPTIPTTSGAVSTILSSNLTASRVLVSNSSGKVAASSNITSTELDYLDGVKSNVQTQLDGKATASTYSAVITTTWEESGKYYIQNIAVTGILATDEPIVDIDSDGKTDEETVLLSDEFSKIFRIITSNNNIKVCVTEQPSVAIPIQLKVVR